MKKKQRNALMRKMIVLLQLITLLGFAAAVLLNQVFPLKYLAAIAGGLFGMWLICFGMQFLKNKVYLLGLILSITLSCAQFSGVYCIEMMDISMDDIVEEVNKAEESSTDNKTDENDAEEDGAADVSTEDYSNTMIAVVKKDNAAGNIFDVAEYSFGVFNEEGNADEILAEIENETGNPVNTKAYEDILDIAWGLLDGEVQAVIFDGTYLPVIEDEIEGYSSKIKILYACEIEK